MRKMHSSLLLSLEEDKRGDGKKRECEKSDENIRIISYCVRTKFLFQHRKKKCCPVGYHPYALIRPCIARGKLCFVAAGLSPGLLRRHEIDHSTLRLVGFRAHRLLHQTPEHYNYRTCFQRYSDLFLGTSE